MASSMIHLAVVQEMMKEVSFRDIARLRLGVILPDGAVEGNSHLKKKICENTRYTYDLEIFREQYGAYMKKDDLYLGYYLHLIQDMLYRRFLYGEHGWNSSIPGNVEKLHRDYEILNGYVAEKYGLSREMVPLDRAFPGKELEVSCIYPKACGDVFHYDDYSKTLQIHFPETYMARLFQIKVK